MRRQPRSPHRAPAPAADGERVITIGWQVVALPLLLLAVVGGGFLVGRVMAQRNAVGVAVPAPAAAQVDAVPGATMSGETMQLVLGDGQVIEVPAQALDPRSRYDPDTVYDVPRRSHPLLGQPAPDFTMTEFGSGSQMRLSDYLGRPVLVDFWATWCPPCIHEMPWLEAMYRKHAQDGFVVLGFNVGEKVEPHLVDAQIQAFVDQYDITFPILVGEVDYEVQRDWTVAGYPAAFLVSAEGVVTDFHQGMFPNQVTLESRLESILSERP